MQTPFKKCYVLLLLAFGLTGIQAQDVISVGGGAYPFNGVSLFIKEGNNGTVSGDTFCKGAHWGRVGFCIAIKRLDTGEYIATDVAIQTPVSCLCGAF